MKRLLVLLAFPFALLAQDSATEQARAQREKLEAIMRIQDLRTPHDGTLTSLLSDRDARVRERATLAFGNLQDTTVIPPLVANLAEGPPGVQRAAAWAIGQTASSLSLPSRQLLEHDLIWVRVDQTAAADRLIEEIGKFGSEQGLGDLLQRFGISSEYSAALTMSIARFAIRGVTSVEGVRYLLKFTKPAESTPWQVVYALQRIGSHDETKLEVASLVQLRFHADPLVRMNLATLLGKLRDAKHSLADLAALAEHDPDWRVRVNALKALGSFPPSADSGLAEIFRRSFTHENAHVSVTALATFGASAARETDPGAGRAFEALRAIASNKDGGYLWQLQAEAALALAKLVGQDALRAIAPASSTNVELQARLIAAAGTTGSAEAAGVLVPFMDDERPLLVRSALEGLLELSRKRPGDSAIVGTTYSAAIRGLAMEDVAVATTAASVLGDSLFLRKAAVGPLLDALGGMRVPDDVEAMQEIMATLGKIGDNRAVNALREQLATHARSVAAAAAGAILAITGTSVLAEIQPMSEPLYVDLDFEFLHSLPETVAVKLETIRGDVVMELYKDAAPFTVMSFLKLATQRGFYRGLSFHRVVPNFVVQGGDPRGDGWGGAGYAIRSEFSPLRYETGTVGVASAGKDTEGSQFFVTQSPQPHLEGRYTIFGKVVRGMDAMNKILVGDHMFNISRLP